MSSSGLRASSLLLSLILLLFAAGLFVRAGWAVQTWPWPAGPLTFMFLSSIAAAIAVPFLWVGVSEEWGAMSGSAIFPFVTSMGSAVFLYRQYASGATTSRLWVAAALAALFSLVVMIWSRRHAIRDGRIQPPLVRVSFAVFALVLILAGGALVMGRPNVMPWPMNLEGQVIAGWIFLGASTSYLYGLLNPAWNNARGPLLGFLVYDLMLLPPLLGHFAKVKPEHRTSLIVYVAVLVYSGTLALYQLFLAKPTRSWTVQKAA